MIQDIAIGTICLLFGGLITMLIKREQHKTPCTTLAVVKQQQEDDSQSLINQDERLRKAEIRQGEDKKMFESIQETLTRILNHLERIENRKK